MQDLKAYRVTCLRQFPFTEVVIAAKTPEQARYRCYKNACAAGFNVKYVDFKARREPEFDQIAEVADQTQWELGWVDGPEKSGCLV